MTKTAINRELRNVKNELEWLRYCEKRRNPNWRFYSHYSKRRTRLVKTYWALRAMKRAKSPARRAERKGHYERYFEHDG